MLNCQSQVQIQIQSRSIPGPFQIYFKSFKYRDTGLRKLKMSSFIYIVVFRMKETLKSSY